MSDLGPEATGDTGVSVTIDHDLIVHVRDRKTGRTLAFTPAEWSAFIAEVDAGKHHL